MSCGRVPCAEALGPRVFIKTHPKRTDCWWSILHVCVAQHAAPPLAATGLRRTPPRAAGGDGTALGPEVPSRRRLQRACSDPVVGSLRFPPAARAALSPRPAAAFCAVSPAATINAAGVGSPVPVRCARCARCSVRPATTTFSSPGRLCAGHMWRCREPAGP